MGGIYVIIGRLGQNMNANTMVWHSLLTRIACNSLVSIFPSAEVLITCAALRARAKITSHFYAPIHPASTPKNVNLFLREP
jgi:hypothetical protein